MVFCVGGNCAAMDLQQYNTDQPDYGLVDGPDGRYLTRQDGSWGQPNQQQIWMIPHGEQQALSPPWASPLDDESDFYFSADLRKGCFISSRGTSEDQQNGDIWCVDWADQGWTEPERLPEPINSAGEEYSPVLAANGDLYFASDRPGGFGMGDLYQGQYLEGAWQVSNLGEQVNTSGGEWNLELSPDGQRLIFEASHRSTNISVAGDLYLSTRQRNGWSAGRALSNLNSSGSDLMLRFLADGTAVYAQSEGGDVDLILVDLQDLE